MLQVTLIHGGPGDLAIQPSRVFGKQRFQKALLASEEVAERRLCYFCRGGDLLDANAFVATTGE